MLQHATLSIATLTPHARNYRKHPESQIIRIAHSLARFGQVRSIVVQEQANGYRIVAGHGVVLAAQYLLNGSDVPITQARMDTLRAGLTADIIPSDWTESDVAGYLVSDNLSSESAEDDLVELAQLLQDQATDGFDLASLGSSEDSLQHLLQGLADEMLAAEGHDVDDPDGGGDDFDATPDEGQTRVQLGDIWQLGRHRVMCGDSTNAQDITQLMNGIKADMLFTDPPYGVDYRGGHFHSGDVRIVREREALLGDDTTVLYDKFLPVVLPFVDGPCYMWFAGSKARDVYNAVFDNHCEIHALLIWHKTNATYAAMNAQYKQRHEPCLYFKPKGSTLRWCGPTDERTVWELPRDPQNIYHPTQKPVSLSIRAIGNHDAQVILDCFGGSGSTLIGAERMGRIVYVNELSPEYVNVILTRWEEETGETATLLSRREEAA